jgi:hypothetical protein
VPGDDGDRYARPAVTPAHPTSPDALRGDRRPLGPAPARATRPRAVTAAVLLALAVLAAPAVGAGPAGARPAQDPTATTLPGETVPGATVPGQTTLPGATATSSTPATETVTSSRVADENRKIWLVVGGLVVVALLLTALTFRYWRQTKPQLLPVAPEPAGPRHAKRARRSRRAVAGADHPTSDDEWEPRGTGEHERIEIPTARKPVKPTRDERAAVLAAHRTRR